MMQANECRIGNWVEFKKKQSYDYTTLTGSSFEGSYIENTFKPIKLTEEWLLKFGFEKDFNNLNGRWQFFISKDGSNVIIEKFNEQWIFIWELNFVGRPIGFVHELQNIYFALTGKELTYIKTL